MVQVDHKEALKSMGLPQWPSQAFGLQWSVGQDMQQHAGMFDEPFPFSDKD